MRIAAVIFPLCVALATAFAEPSAPPPATTATAPPGSRDTALGSREAALEQLLAERASPAALDRAVANARANGGSEQAILEARFLYHIDRHEDAAIAAMLPEFLKQREVFKLEDSATFGVTEDWLAVIEYVQALAALGNGDKLSFKSHITEAFWLSPRQAAAFAPHIERLRLEDAMRSLQLDFALPLTPLLAGEAVTLDQLRAGKQALLLHFWSPRSRECEASLPDFRATAAALASNKIAVVSLLPDDSAQLLSEARAMLRPLGDPPPGVWLLDSKQQSLARKLRIQNLPAVVLVSAAGKILFNGDPTDESFWAALHLLDAAIQRPLAAPQHD